ncbi:uncharacterized protein LOC119662722 [Teleopsis dalmanni]|uniref:uncharacterized protein LOC119662722 n=1 Tax=Teleopsis dalmanni TaxID=139649 RepID=UPI0018CED681|nr:uncharacterized protein LOC119662722 [Teleopsis dalmanni]XP_037928351.1 uncharacterized protein LOC119662722 [Teleopsis dalmanni]XP_037928352.1 uncharacterized protein LOC119662722 [Teleopsis dalmanni]XP_037928353.1 uncharacterized protein LOC119662722 [Teleopsis dalmanni]
MEFNPMMSSHTRRRFEAKLDDVRVNSPFYAGGESDDELMQKKRWVYPPKRVPPKPKSCIFPFLAKIFEPFKKPLKVIGVTSMLFIVAMMSITSCKPIYPKFTPSVFPFVNYMYARTTLGYVYSVLDVCAVILFTAMASCGYFWGFISHEPFHSRDYEKIDDMELRKGCLKARYGFLLIGPYVLYVASNLVYFVPRAMEVHHIVKSFNLPETRFIIPIMMALSVVVFVIILQLALFVYMGAQLEEAIQTTVDAYNPIKYYLQPENLLPFFHEAYVREHLKTMDTEKLIE